MSFTLSDKKIYFIAFSFIIALSFNIVKPDSSHISSNKQKIKYLKEYFDFSVCEKKYSFKYRQSPDYYDFSVNKDILNTLKSEKIYYLPRDQLMEKNSGNFLHFYRIAYQQRLPILFSADSLLYGFIKQYKNIIKLFKTEVFSNLLKVFLQKLILYIQKLKFDENTTLELKSKLSSTQIFFSIALDFLIEGIDTFKPGEDIIHEFNSIKFKIRSFSSKSVKIFGKT